MGLYFGYWFGEWDFYGFFGMMCFVRWGLGYWYDLFWFVCYFCGGFVLVFWLWILGGVVVFIV